MCHNKTTLLADQCCKTTVTKLSPTPKPHHIFSYHYTRPENQKLKWFYGSILQPMTAAVPEHDITYIAQVLNSTQLCNICNFDILIKNYNEDCSTKASVWFWPISFKQAIVMNEFTMDSKNDLEGYRLFQNLKIRDEDIVVRIHSFFAGFSATKYNCLLFIQYLIHYRF